MLETERFGFVLLSLSTRYDESITPSELSPVWSTPRNSLHLSTIDLLDESLSPLVWSPRRTSLGGFDEVSWLFSLGGSHRGGQTATSRRSLTPHVSLRSCYRRLSLETASLSPWLRSTIVDRLRLSLSVAASLSVPQKLSDVFFIC